ncbi:MAG: hypothetical protein ACP5U0_08355 [Caldisphaera sp.]
MDKVTLKLECDLKRRVCIIRPDPYKNYQEIQQEPVKGNMQNYPQMNIRDINSGRDTNLDSFNTYDEIADENGNILIRRPNNVIINNYGSIKFS